MLPYQDAFQTRFQEELQFRNFLVQRKANSDWGRHDTNQMTLLALTGDEGDFFYQSIVKTLGKDVARDTLDNTGLAVLVDSKLYPLRSCALKTLQERAKISGHSLRELPKRILAEILNHCIRISKGKGLYYVADGKISAIHAGNKGNYCILEMVELYDSTNAFLGKEFSEYHFIQGDYDHKIISAFWGIDDCTLLDDYKAVLKKYGIKTDEITAGLKLTTSNVGVSGANLQGVLNLKGGQTMPLGSPIKLEHKHGASLAKFEENLSVLFSQYTKKLELVASLLEIPLRYPINTMLRVMKKIGLTQGLAAQAANLFADRYDLSKVTAFDAYYGICEVLFLMQCQQVYGTRMVSTEENVTKAITIPWEHYDIPGDFYW